MINIEEGCHYRAVNGAVFINAEAEMHYFILKSIANFNQGTGKFNTVTFMSDGKKFPELNEDCELNLIEKIEWYEIPNVFDKPVLCKVKISTGEYINRSIIEIKTIEDCVCFYDDLGKQWHSPTPLTSAEIDALKSPFF